ncbi:MAG: hypothetical protein GC145_18550 [Caulobacter sp.]|nr:hypothetical protein [Caulobacter sp.]
MTDLNLKLVLQALDRGASPTVRRFTATVHGLSREVKDSPRGWTAMTGAIGRTTSAAERFNTAGRGNIRTLDALIERQRRLRREESLGNVAGGRRGGGAVAAGGLARLAGGAGGLIGLGVAAAGGLAVSGSIMGGRRILDEGARRDGFVARLTAIDKTREAAKTSLKWIDKFSIHSGQDLDQVTDAYVRLRTRGIDPAGGSLAILAGAAVANDKTLGNAVETFLKAQQGQFGTLDDYAIQARKVGRQVVFTWEQDGKRMTATSSRTAAGVRKSLSSILASKYGGALDADRTSWPRLVQRAELSRDSFLGRIADKGLMDKAKGHLTSFLDFLEKAEADGRLDKWAERISTSLSDAMDSLVRFGKSVDWVKLAEDIGTLANAVATLASAIPRLRKAAENSPLHNFFDLGALDRAFPMSGESTIQYDWEKHRNPWAASQRRRSTADARPTILGANRPLAGLGGGPLAPAKPLTGKLEISLAPGLVLKGKESSFGFDLTERRGPTGGQP